jgi:hypothetical protein
MREFDTRLLRSDEIDVSGHLKREKGMNAASISLFFR